MNLTEKYLTYRGEIQAIYATGRDLYFVTEHPEGQTTSLYCLDPESGKLEATPLPQGSGRSIVLVGERVFVGGSTGHLFQGDRSGGKVRETVALGSTPIVALATLSETRLAVGYGSHVAIVQQEGKKPHVVQTLELSSDVTKLASDPSGVWLVIGTQSGEVTVYQSEQREDYAFSDARRIHNGPVTALLTEPDELRFLSAGGDRKLYTTHARGTLEPEDKGKSYTHDEPIMSIVWAPGDRFITASSDGVVKTWARTGGGRPAALREGVAKLRTLAIVTVHDRPRLVSVGQDNILRFIALDAAGKFGDPTARYFDANQRASHELSRDDPKRRETAITELATFGDTKSLELLAAHARNDRDSSLRLDAVRRVVSSSIPRAIPLLEGLLSHQDEAARVLAFDGLRERLGEEDLRPIDLALKSGKADIGRRAVEALGVLAQRQDQAFDRLLSALDAHEWEVRRTAGETLEVVDPSKPAEANLTALQSQSADLRRWALLRLLHRGLLDDPQVAIALRRQAEEADAEVRRVAALLMIRSRPLLGAVLRDRDPELDRQLSELEAEAGFEGSSQKAKATGGRSKTATKKKTKGSQDDPPSWSEADIHLLLNASASRAVDTAILGARALAVLGDRRAFGLLLQLSREEDETARVEVCRALATLGDPRSVDRLRSLLADQSPSVRDAAFSGLALLLKKEPLQAAEAGLTAPSFDVRRRGLQILLDEIRRKPPTSSDQATGQLLLRALNDPASEVRSESFKALLNLQLFGGSAATLRFGRRCIHEEIRREILTELMAQSNEPWVWDLLFECFNDPDERLRLDAFQFVTKKSRGLEPLEAALNSRYPDLRLVAIAGLVKKRSVGAQAVLATAVEDSDRTVRLAALDGLIDVGANTAIATALTSPASDVCVRAGKTLARLGDQAVLGPMVTLATMPEPQETERKEEWRTVAADALDALAELGDPDAIVPVLPLLESNEASLRKGAARVLAWSYSSDREGLVREALAHTDPEVKYRIAMGLAMNGDASLAPLLDSDDGAKVVGVGDRLAVAAALGAAGEDTIVNTLDHSKPAARSRAFLLLLAREFKGSKSSGASRLLTALASRSPRIRLDAADALQHAADHLRFRTEVTRLLNERGDRPRWSIPESTVDALCNLLVWGTPFVRARTASKMLRHLDPSVEKQDAFDLAWQLHAKRFESELDRLESQDAEVKSDRVTADQDHLVAQAFGAYVGLIREQGGRSYQAASAPNSKKRTKAKKGNTKRKQIAPDPEAIRVRCLAIDRLTQLASQHSGFATDAPSVFIRALSDPHQSVRFLAFDQLQALKYDPAKLGAEALAAGHTDVGVKGLEVLSGASTDMEAGSAVLKQVMMTRKDELAIKAAELLRKRLGTVPVASLGMEASFESLRSLSISWLAEQPNEEEAARDVLRRGLDSRYAANRHQVARALATKKDPVAFEALVQQLQEANDRNAEVKIIRAFEELGDPRASAVLLDRIENDQSGTTDPNRLLSAVARFRHLADVDHLFRLLTEQAKWRGGVFRALLAISGYDAIKSILQQDRILDDEAIERAEAALDRFDAKDLPPRRDELVVRLFERCLDLDALDLVQELLPIARWSPTTSIDPHLSRLTTHSDDAIRQKAVGALAWRLRWRNGPVDPLIQLLQHPDHTTEFIAAEGLALGGRHEGTNVLLAAIDFFEDLPLRRRAVRALGMLEDPQALDRLLKLASDPGHALQGEAVEAIGRLGRTSKRDQVLRLLLRYSRSGEQSLTSQALNGLSFLNVPEAWERLREIVQEQSPFSLQVIQLLSSNNDPATRDLLLGMIREFDSNRSRIAGLPMVLFGSARKLFDLGSLEPDIAGLRGLSGSWLIDPIAWNRVKERHQLTGELPLDRVRDRGTVADLFRILDGCSADVADALEALLIQQDDLPIAEARQGLRSESSAVVRVSARIVAAAQDPKAGPVLAEVLPKWLTIWSDTRASDQLPKHDEDDWDIDDEEADEEESSSPLLAERSECLERLIRAAGRVSVAVEELIRIVTMHEGDSLFKTIRMGAVEALVELPKPTLAVFEALESLATGTEATLRRLAADALVRLDPDRVVEIADSLLTDPYSFARVSEEHRPVLGDRIRLASSRVQEQGLVIPALVASGDYGAMADVLKTPESTEAARLGAVEGLASLASEAAESVLLSTATSETQDEEIRKAAWRGLRRSKRARRRSPDSLTNAS